ncbi:carboxymuconolactone decarboxylase family protein [Pseudomonas sp.]|uniref:carboxymuconolactone decarboxylase family protein n=1 Tax=Pseudomonas sp. TaxID=306 RepID=UPI0028A87A1E|nr:carboxymuconolactone decarboxylase family protein [Pseudomonas sp.]
MFKQPRFIAVLVCTSLMAFQTLASQPPVNTPPTSDHMRLPLLAPDRLDVEQKRLYEDMKSNVPANFDAFKIISPTGAMFGPQNIWLTEPKYGRRIWELAFTMSKDTILPDEARQVTILAVGAHFNSAFELYAHNAIARRAGMSEQRLSSLATGTRPVDLSPTEAVAYDVTVGLLKGGPLPEPTYNLGVATYGKDGMLELVYLVGLYSFVSTTLNAYDVKVP